MKKNLKSLKLNKKSISNLNANEVKGGITTFTNNVICETLSIGKKCTSGSLSLNNCPPLL